MSATAGTVLFAMTLLIAFLYGVILWRREGWMDRTDETVDEHDRKLILIEGRINGLADYLGVDIHDPVPDGPDEYVPEADWAPRAMEPASLEPATEPIPVCPPTQPDMKAAAKVAPLPVVDASWEEKSAAMLAEFRAAAAEIGGGGR